VSIAFGATSIGQDLANQTIGNLSIRGQVSPSTQFISGFVIEGRASTSVLIRGIGPALARFGVEDALLRPLLTVYDARGEPIAQNAGWGTRPTEERDVMKRLGSSFPLAENSNDCGLVLTLAPGPYTVQLSGVSGAAGIGLIELYHGNGYGIIPQSAPISQTYRAAAGWDSAKPWRLLACGCLRTGDYSCARSDLHWRNSASAEYWRIPSSRSFGRRSRQERAEAHRCQQCSSPRMTTGTLNSPSSWDSIRPRIPLCRSSVSLGRAPPTRFVRPRNVAARFP
jgi:hypothetical protein